MFRFNVAFNNVFTPKNKKIVVGYGGGPYYTSMEEITIHKIHNAQAYRFAAQLDLKKVAKDLNLLYAYGHFDGKENGVAVEYEENDIVLSYQFYKQLDLEITYADIKDNKQSGSANKGFDRVLARMNYFF